MFHAFLGEKLPDWKSAANLVRKIAENYKLPYYTLSPTYSICKNHGYLSGELKSCPVCGEKTEIYSRITGYYRPVQNWNDGKVQEFEDRQVYMTSRIDMDASCRNDITLFGTKTCPNCIQAEKILNNAGINFVKILAEDKPELVASLKIMRVPTLIVGNRMFVGLGEIYKFINKEVKQIE